MMSQQCSVLKSRISRTEGQILKADPPTVTLTPRTAAEETYQL